MSDRRRVQVDGFEFFSRMTRTRFPFRYGIASMTEAPHVFARAHVRVDDRPALGVASEGLPPKWFTKDPRTTFDQDLPAMREVIGRAARFMSDAGARPQTFHRLWRETYDAQESWARANGTPSLLANLGVSLCERAVLDGFCRALGASVQEVLRANRVGLELGDIHPELRGAQPAEFLPEGARERIVVRHTVGLADPLTPGDVAEGDRVNDGLPQDLESAIRAYGLRAFKVKLSADTARDVDRLAALDRVIAGGAGDGWFVTLDGNENFTSLAAFRAFWEQLRSDPGLARLLSRVVVVEQPVHRDRALEEGAGQAIEAWEDRPPLIIDESDGALGDVRRALGIGYVGTSHKNCKGVLKGVAHACLLEWHRRNGRRAVLTGEDLCNLGPVALLQDFAVMAALGLEHVERNGHHYYRGLSPWPRDWSETTLHAHPDLYVADGDLVRVRIENGEASLKSVNAAPFGIRPLLDPSRFEVFETGG
jgi:hypothetical protein